MTGQEVAQRTPGGLAVPQGARRLGVRVKPIIRLGMGVKVEGERRDGSTYTRPSKTDYFTVRGDDRAVKKFTKTYGDKPKSVRIMVPSELSLALDISYRAFVGGGDDEGGRPLALGMTNFAPLGYVGGPDVLRVWKQDGSYAEVETAGLDELGKPLDDIAAQLGIEVHTTFTFTVPDVLGWGSFAQVTSKGKKSADNLTFKLGEIYSAFGARAPWAFDDQEPPLLVLKPDTALTRFEKDGETRWGKTKIFVLDIVIPEPFHQMQQRMLEHERSLGDPVDALYAPERPAIEVMVTPEEAPADESSQPPLGQAGAVAGTGGDEEDPQAASTPDAVSPAAGAGGSGPDEPVQPELPNPGDVEIPGGDHHGRKISQVARTKAGRAFLLHILKTVGDQDVTRQAIAAYAEASLPELWRDYTDWHARQAA